MLKFCAVGTRARKIRMGRVLSMSAVAASLLSGNVLAQAPAANSEQASSAETASSNVVDDASIVVTASRLTGFTAPTPTMVLGQQQIQATAPLQVVDILQLVPSFRTTSAPASATVYPDLRGIGPQRTLVLVNGRRHVATTSNGTVDLGVIPAILVERTEVVTGGASASWGSGAVAGVVNLILKNQLEGVEGTVQSGISSRGDSQNYLAALAAGTSFAGGRGHVMIGGEYSREKGIRSLQQPYRARPWSGRGSVGNSAFATNGQPGTIYDEDTRRADVSEGGLITSGPLRGITFLPNGGYRQFGYGTVYGNNMIGGTDNAGDAPTPGGDLKYPYERYNVLARVSYDVTDSFNLFAEGSYAHVISKALTFPARNNGAILGNPSCTQAGLAGNLGSILMPITNPYLPEGVRQLALDAGVTCLNIGRVFREDGLGDQRTEDGSPDVYRAVVGAGGTAFGNMEWSAYYQYGYNKFQASREGNLIIANMNRALDAVRVGDRIVCRVNADAISTNDDPACAPFNLFGRGSASAEAVDYVSATSVFRSVNKQHVAAASISGDIFSLWAGPISMALGAEWRKESINSVADPIAQANGYQTGNSKALVGSYTAKEAFGELGIPLLRDSVLARSLDLNLAARVTDYSSSGRVTTWKVGGVWDVTSDIRLRASQSRDIRAGNLSELFTPTAVQAGNVRDPRTSAVTPVNVTTIGNRTLRPEEADTFTAGLVLSPSWFDGFRASVDYYNIKVAGQIGTIGANQVVERCYLDNLPEFCAQVATNSAGTIIGVTVNFQNLDRFESEGLDFEVSYRMPVSRLFANAEGNLSARVLATYIGKLATTAAANATVTDPSGQITSPHWSVFGLLSYEGARLSTTLDLRWFQGGKIDNTRVEGAIAANGVNINHSGSTLYTNLTFNADVSPNADKRAELFFRVNNLFDVAPPFPNTTEGATIFDPVGRAFRVGIRFRR